MGLAPAVAGRAGEQWIQVNPAPSSLPRLLTPGRSCEVIALFRATTLCRRPPAARGRDVQFHEPDELRCSDTAKRAPSARMSPAGR